jgi:hypothetical protein
MSNDQFAEWDALVKKIDVPKPQPEDLEAFRALLTKLPEAWGVVGDLASQVSVGLVRALNGPASYRESIEHGMMALSRALGYDQAPALERLLIDQVVICWLRMYLAEGWYSQKQEQGGPLQAMEHIEKVLSTTQRRYLRAIESLARVRKLQIALQINIGEKQVNIAGEGLSTGDH